MGVGGAYGAVGVLAKTKNYAIAGLVPLFPTFALIAHYIVASERGIEALRATIVFGMWSILPYFIYLLSLCHHHFLPCDDFHRF